MSTDYQLPALQWGSSEAVIVQWLKQPGDRLVPTDPLVVVVNDRAEVVLPALHEGLLVEVLVQPGMTVQPGLPIARISRATEGAGEIKGAQPLAASAQLAAPRRASPVALRMASVEGVDLRNLVGSGPGGRLLKCDIVEALGARDGNSDGVNGGIQAPHISTAIAPVIVTSANGGAGTHVLARAADQPSAQVLAPSTMRRVIAEHMVRSRATSPHAMTAMEVDMGGVAAERTRLRVEFAKRGLDLTYTAYIATAVVEALLRHPLLNSSWSDDGIVIRRRIHLSIAVALPDGLVTPVVRNAQDLNLRGMARAVGTLAQRTRAGQLQPGEMSGGTFTITNPGGGAIWFGTPVINQPQAAILGVGAIRSRPLVVTERGVDQIVVRPTALMTLSYDARVMDQDHADAFLGDVKRALERVGRHVSG